MKFGKLAQELIDNHCFSDEAIEELRQMSEPFRIL